jgi:hypothetical protein
LPSTVDLHVVPAGETIVAVLRWSAGRSSTGEVSSAQAGILGD